MQGLTECLYKMGIMIVLLAPLHFLGCGQEVYVSGFDVAKRKVPAAQSASPAVPSDSSGDISSDAL